MNEVSNNLVTAIPVTKDHQSVAKLTLINNLLDAFHEQNVKYCHWKSNEHLEASMKADTDLDLLFDEGEKERVVKLFDNLGFKKFSSISQRQYQDIEDYIGLDIQSGKIIHLHTHFRLTIGEAYLKSYQVNLEPKILETRVYDEVFGIYRTLPAFELILLCIRMSLKIRNRDIAGIYLKNKVSYSGNVLREYKWLKQRCTDQEIERILRDIFINYQPIYKIVTGDFNRKQLWKLSFLIKKEFKTQRLFSPIQSLILRWYREASITIFKKAEKFLNRPVISQRINPRGGLIVAIIGADGSGKSTVIAQLESTFKKKLDVYRIYMGKGSSGRTSLLRRLIVAFKRNMSRSKKTKQVEEGAIKYKVKRKGLRYVLFECMQELLVANEKSRNLKLMNVAKRKGMLVICDRFPQNQIKGYNDGPALHHLAHSTNPFFRAFSKLEERVYANAENTPPDLVFKLITDAKVAEARKPRGTSPELLEVKIEGIKQLHFAKSCKVITVDASQPLDQVLQIIKKEIWKAY